MFKIKDPSKCSGCGACVAICPTNSLSLVADNEGFLYPEADLKKCVSCGKCENICPFAQTAKQEEYQPIVAAVKAKDENLRFNSSSGGMFSLLAEKCFQKKGVVCGAVMSEDCREVRHIIIDDPDDLISMRGSKYIPSNLGDAFLSIRSLLEDGRQVLFSGVSCQVAGLKAFLGKEYDNLITVEIICHGLPSPRLWEKYIENWEKTHNKRVKKVYFRSKKISWNRFTVNNITSNGKEYFQLASINAYFRMFNSGMALRKSCYKCSVKQGNSGADISIGDFWHIEDYAPDFADDKGVSLVLINSEKGQIWFEALKSEMNYIIDPQKFTFSDAARFNPGVAKSLEIDVRRESFYSDLERLGMNSFIKKYVPLSFKQKCKGYLMKTRLYSIMYKNRRSGGVKHQDME